MADVAADFKRVKKQKVEAPFVTIRAKMTGKGEAVTLIMPLTQATGARLDILHISPFVSSHH